MTRLWSLLLGFAVPARAQDPSLVPDACRVTRLAAVCAGLGTPACQGAKPSTDSGTPCLLAEDGRREAARERVPDAAARETHATERRADLPSRGPGPTAVQGARRSFRNAGHNDDAQDCWGGRGAGMAAGSCLVRLPAAQVDDLGRLAGGER